jgi:hypothetical protein
MTVIKNFKLFTSQHITKMKRFFEIVEDLSEVLAHNSADLHQSLIPIHVHNRIIDVKDDIIILVKIWGDEHKLIIESAHRMMTQYLINLDEFFYKWVDNKQYLWKGVDDDNLCTLSKFVHIVHNLHKLSLECDGVYV